MAYYGDEDYDYHRRRRSPRGYYNDNRRSQQYLDPGNNGGGLYRTRSTGHAPQPVVNNIYMDQMTDANLRAESPYRPSPAPQPPQAAPVPYPQAVPVPYPQAVPVQYPQAVPVQYPQAAPVQYPASPEFRGRRLGDNIVEDLAGMALRDQLRSRSRGRTDASLMDRPDFAEWRLHQKEHELEEEKKRRLRELDETQKRQLRELDETRKRQLWEKEAELRRLQDQAKHEKAEHDAEEAKKRFLHDYEDKKRIETQRANDAEEAKKRYIQDYEEKKRKEAQKAKEEEIRVKEKMERDRKEAREEEERVRQKIEREKREAKEEEERIIQKIEREKREAKEKEEREWKEFLVKQREKDDKEKAEKKAEKEKIESEMRRRLAKFGYTEDVIDVMVDEEKAKKYKEDHARSPRRHSPSVPTSQLVSWKSERSPVYAKVHRDYLSVDTLVYYDIPYEFDRVDPDYIIIMREMDKHETEVLFEHTKRLRSGKLLLEAPKEKPKYAMYRKRDRSTSRVRKVGILEYKKVL